MAPMTRRSQANTGVAKKVHRKRGGAQATAAKRQNSDSWELLDREGLNGHERDDTPDDHDHDEDRLALDGPREVRDAIDPLREMADRIGNEVELFAETMDEYLQRMPSAHNESLKFEWANELIQDFHLMTTIAASDLDRTQWPAADRQARRELSEQARASGTVNGLKQSSLLKSSLLGEKKAQYAKGKRDLQKEADLWDLMHIMLELRPFETEAEQEREERRSQLHKMGPAHRYTSEDELWQRFTLSNDAAIERKKIKEWLERTADHQESDIMDVVSELESKAGRGKGLWTSGWMFTREKIKGEKRLRSWPADADLNPPQIKRAEDDDLLATRVDPDAPARQERVLEKPDAYFERAIWIASWEMLRRGVRWAEICEWCEERKEGWRATCLGLTVDTAEPGSSKAAWRHLCRLAAQSGVASDHEAAVFGLLGGSEEAMKKVCRSVNDRIYAFYNAKLLRAFDSFVVTTCPDRVSFARLSRKVDANALETTEQAGEATSALLARLRKEAATQDEMLQPLKVIQSYMLADEVVTLLNTVGIMVGEAARAQDAEGVIFFRSRKPVDVDQQTGEREVALNANTLRMAAHMSIIYRVLLRQPLEGDDVLEDDNILVAYIQALRMAGKRDLIPMYASRLQEDRHILVLGRVLSDISEGEEQNRMLKMLQHYGLDVIQILTEHLNIAFENSFADSNPNTKPLRVLEQTAETKLHPGQKIIPGFLPDEISQADEGLVTALQWFQLYHGHWSVTFKVLTAALVRCLLHGNLACARLIVQTFPYDTIALRKSYETTGTAFNPMDPSSTPQPHPLDKRDRMLRDLMARQSRTYHELEILVRALEALAHWGGEEARYIDKAPRPPTVPASLKQAKAGVTETMESIIMKGILMNPRDEQEARDLAWIRRTFVPEVVLAYNVVLHAAGNLITRDCLLESMDLSVAIAQEKGESGSDDGVAGNGLADVFTQAGRMRELADSFALTSKVMLVLKAEGKPWRARKDREGKELGVWEIGVKDVGAE